MRAGTEEAPTVSCHVRRSGLAAGAALALFLVVSAPVLWAPGRWLSTEVVFWERALFALSWIGLVAYGLQAAPRYRALRIGADGIERYRWFREADHIGVDELIGIEELGGGEFAVATRSAGRVVVGRQYTHLAEAKVALMQICPG